MMRLDSSRLTLDDDIEHVSRWFAQQGLSDGLPIVPPTAPRVERMLSGTTRSPSHSLGRMPPANGDCTVEKVAVNAVMAGCLPEYLPVLISAMELLLDPQWDLAGLQPTTNPYTPMLIVNGPIRHRIGLNSGAGAMGTGWRANASIGRAVRLLLLNVGGARPPDIDKCTQGFVGKYGLCVGENEEESPWPPLSTTRGFAPGQDVVTAVGVNSSTNIHDSSDRWEDLVHTLLGSLPSPGSANVTDPHSTPVIALNPLHARILDRAGIDRAALQDRIFQDCTLPADALSDRRAHLRRAHGDDAFLVNGRIPFTNDPRSVILPVVGGLGGGHSCYLANGRFGHAASRLIAGFPG
jgi:hypothetical protein